MEKPKNKMIGKYEVLDESNWFYFKNRYGKYTHSGLISLKQIHSDFVKTNRYRKVEFLIKRGNFEIRGAIPIPFIKRIAKQL